MKLSILTPERKLLEAVEVSEITVPTQEGIIQILPGHIPFVGVIETGVLKCSVVGKPEQFRASVSSGFIHVHGDHVEVVAETLELPHEIDRTRARAAQEKAERILREGSLGEAEFKKYQLKLQRSLIRQQLSDK